MSNIAVKKLKVSLRTPDLTRRADLELGDDRLGSDIMQSAVDHWALPSDTDYSLVNVTTGQILNPRESLAGRVNEGDILEVQPVLVAG